MSYHRNRSKDVLALQHRIVRSSGYVSNSGLHVTSSWNYKNPEQTVTKREIEGIDWDGNGRNYWHQCTHSKTYEEQRFPSVNWDYNSVFCSQSFPGYDKWPDGYRYEVYPTGEAYLYEAPQGGSATWFDVPSDSVYKPVDVTNDASFVSHLDWGTAYEQVLDDAAGLMPSDTSVGVNIAEFGQLKRMVPGIARNIRSLLNYVKGHPNKTVRRYKYLFDKKTGKRIPWTATIETVKLRSLSWSLRDLSSLNLGFHFGVLPLADDVGNWAGKFYQLQQHMKWYSTRNGRASWFRAKTNVIEESRDEHADRRSLRIGADALWETKKMSTLQGILHVKARVTAKSGSAYYNALLTQALGMNVPLQIAWDLVPFSFVADWFLPVGELISRIEPRRALGSLAKRVIIEDTWHSLRGSDEYLARIVALEPNTPERDFSLLDGGLARKGRTDYVRRRGTPAYNILPTGNVRFGGRQFHLSLSLLVQRLTRRH